MDVQTKLDRIEGDLESKTATLEELKRELHKVRQTITQHQAIISSLMSDCGPLQVLFVLFRISWMSNSQENCTFSYFHTRTHLETTKCSNEISRKKPKCLRHHY